MTGGRREEETQVRGEGRDADMDMEVGLGGGAIRWGEGFEEEGVEKGVGAKAEVQNKEGQGLRRTPEGRVGQRGRGDGKGPRRGSGRRREGAGRAVHRTRLRRLSS